MVNNWKIKRKNEYGTLWEKTIGLNPKNCTHSEIGTKDLFVDVKKRYEHGGYNPRSLWYVFFANNNSDLSADYVFTSRRKAESKAIEYMRRN